MELQLTEIPKRRNIPSPFSRRCGAVASADDATVLWRGGGPAGGGGGGGGVLGRVGAPAARRGELVLIDGEERRSVAMSPEEDGFFSHVAGDVPDGQRYVYRLDGGDDRPDPCSLWQPEGIPGPSAVVRPAA